MAKWERMPTTWGPHWFTPKIEDRDLAKCLPVSRVEYGSGVVEFHSGYQDVITPDRGWWLLIPDERKTADIAGG